MKVVKPCASIGTVFLCCFTLEFTAAKIDVMLVKICPTKPSQMLDIVVHTNSYFG